MSFGGSVKLTGESEYRKAIQNCISSLQSMSTALKNETTYFNSSDKAIKNSAAAQKELNETIKAEQAELAKAKSQYASFQVALENQTTKHNLLNKEYKAAVTELERIKKASGENSQEYQKQAQYVDKLEKELVESTEAMNESKSSMANLKSEINNSNKVISSAEKALNDLGNEAEDSGKQAEKSSDGFTVMKGVLSNLASTAITQAINGMKKLGTAIVNVAKQSVGSYAEYEQLVGGVDTLFKESSGKVQKYASEAYKTAGVSANKYMEQATSFSASLLQGLGGDTEKAAEIANLAIIDMADNANKMGTSIEMIQNAYQGFAKDNFTMLDNLKLGYGGTAGEMARLINDTGVMGKTFKATAKNVKDIPFDKMIEAIHKVQTNLNITGTTSLEAAHTIQGAVNSMKASWSNLLTAIADDNADLGKSVDQFVNSAVTAAKNVLPRVKQVVEGIKKLINGLITEVFPRLKREIPQLEPLINVFEWFVKNKQLVVGAVTAMVGAFALNKITTFTKSLTGLNTFIVSLTASTALNTAATTADTVAQGANATAKGIAATATGVLTAAQQALNAAWTANPIGLILTGLTALVGVYALIKSKTNELTDAEKEQNAEMKNVKNTLDDYSESMENLDKQKENYIQTNMGEIDHYKDLYNELRAITDENGKVQDGYEKRAEFIVNTLNDALGTEIKLTGNIVENYKDLEDKIYNVIDAKRAQILVEANEGAYNDAKNQKVKLEEAYADAIRITTERETARNDALQEMADYLGMDVEKLKEFVDENGRLDTQKLKDYNEEMGIVTTKVSEMPGKYNELRNSIINSNDALNESQSTLQTARDSYTQNQQTISDYESALMNLKDKNYEAVLGIYEDTHTYIGKTDEETFNNYQKQIDMQKDYLSELDKNKDNYNEEYLKQERDRANANIKNLEEEQSKYKTKTDVFLYDNKKSWLDNTASLLTQLTGKNTEFRDVGGGQVQWYEDGMAVMQPMARSEAESIARDTLNQFDKKLEAEGAGKDLLRGFINGEGNSSIQTSAFKVARNFAGNILMNIKSKLGISSPSKETKKFGAFLVQGLGIGIEKEEDSVLKEANDFGKSVIGSINDGLSDSINTSAISDIGFMSNKNVNRIGGLSGQTETKFSVVEAFKEALSQMKVVMDGEEMGKFVEDTVSDAIFN